MRHQHPLQFGQPLRGICSHFQPVRQHHHIKAVFRPRQSHWLGAYIGLWLVMLIHFVANGSGML